MIGVGANRLPQIGRLKGHANVYYAQAYSGQGLNMTHLAGQLIAQAITHQACGHGFDLFADRLYEDIDLFQRTDVALTAIIEPLWLKFGWTNESIDEKVEEHKEMLRGQVQKRAGR